MRKLACAKRCIAIVRYEALVVFAPSTGEAATMIRPDLAYSQVLVGSSDLLTSMRLSRAMVPSRLLFKFCITLLASHAVVVSGCGQPGLSATFICAFVRRLPKVSVKINQSRQQHSTTRNHQDFLVWDQFILNQSLALLNAVHTKFSSLCGKCTPQWMTYWQQLHIC